PLRCHHHFRHSNPQDGLPREAPVRTDARSEVRDLHGKLLELRRSVLGTWLSRSEGGGSCHPGRCLCAGMSPASRSTAGGACPAARQGAPSELEQDIGEKSQRSKGKRQKKVWAGCGEAGGQGVKG